LFELDYVLAELGARRGRSDSPERRARLLAQMRLAFPGAEIAAPKNQVYDYGLVDPDDGHVAHAAILGKADAIVTDDSRAGFAASAALREAGVEVISPAVFAANSVAAHPEAGLRTLVAVAARMRQPALSPVEVLDQMRRRYGISEAAALLIPRLQSG